MKSKVQSVGKRAQRTIRKRARSTRRRATTRLDSIRTASDNGRVPWLTVVGARRNNLRGMDVDIPLGRFVCVTGVSGSGKSSLVNDILREALARDLNGSDRVDPGDHDRIEGFKHLDKVIDIDQTPIGRTPRSNPATYIKVFDEIRALFARLPDSRVRGYKPGRFSFNVHTGRAGGGRCEACEGNGSNKMEMDFLADVWVTCPVCEGRRFNHETLQILYKGRSIADVLEMDVQEALTHFEAVPKIARMLGTLHEVGLDYLKLGQPSPTLSGGEAQRIKLARELVKRSTGRTVYLLDEPTTGLHFDDIKKLLAVLHRFVDEGNSVIVIEHNMDVIKTADWIIDLGPEGGERGGRVVAAGTPEHVARCRRSYTGAVLRELFDAQRKEGKKATGQEGKKARRQEGNGTTESPSPYAHLQRRRAADFSPRGPTERRMLHHDERSDSQQGDHGPVDRRHPNRDRERKAATGDPGRWNGKTRLDAITVVGAKQHNLKDITVEVPRGRITVCAGPSGSGKSSFAIDTVYTEGQRRYVESLSAYARQFLSRLQPPKVDHVHGLSPSICIEHRTTSRSPRSTVGTITEIYDYMRILWARIGQPHCPTCGIPVGTQSSEEIVQRILELGHGARVLLLAPIEPEPQETHDELFKRLRTNGYARVRVNGAIRSLDDPGSDDAGRIHRVELVVDRLRVDGRHRGRLADSVEQALSAGGGDLIALIEDRRRSDVTVELSEHRFSQHLTCHRCGRGFGKLTPHHFSFNTRMGWCPSCEGLGVQRGTSASTIVVHPTRSITDGAIGAWGKLEEGSMLQRFVTALANHIGLDLDAPWNELRETDRLAILHGCGDEWIPVHPGQTPEGPRDEPRDKPSRDRKGAVLVRETGTLPDGRSSEKGFSARSNRHEPDQPYSGIGSIRFQWHGFFPAIHRATRSSWRYRKRLEHLVTEVACDACAGGRLQPEPAAVKVGGATIHEVCLRPLSKAFAWFKRLKLSARDKTISGELLHEIRSRLGFLVAMGLDYITLHRTGASLSGGESQRIQLASQIGTGLTGVLYVLDEPTIGLHPRDNHRLIEALKRLRDLGNTLLLVEHDREIIDASDHLLDFGPGAGTFGGEVTAKGTPKRLRSRRASLTGRYLSGKQAIPVPSNRRPVDDHVPRLTVHGARENNLREIDAAFPLGRFTCVTGVSGSGKSTLVSQILYRALACRIHRSRLVPGGHDHISGIDHVDKVINVDQTPIGNSPTSNPATYTGLFDAVRELYARLPDSKIRGYTANRFSFNRPGGRCEACEGMGQRCIEMHFLPDVWITCESCGGARYEPQTLQVRYRGKNIADVLNMRVSGALQLFANVPKIRKMLKTLDDVGLGYVQLGQSAPTLSAGEAQRVKLAAELGRPQTGKTLYILDEPTTGLHFDDLKKLLAVLHRLVDLGNACICIEHNLDVIKTADWVIDLGPEAGADGGTIVAEGTPESLAAAKSSHTGRALKPVLQAGPVAERPVYDPSRDTQGLDAAGPIDLGDGVRMPWERDGRSWHTVNPMDRAGQRVSWDSALLIWLVETMEKLGPFNPTDWNHRTRIEISAGAGKNWFCHILTGDGQLLDVAIRVPSRTFEPAELRRQLKIKTLDERTDLPVYGQWSRIRVRRLQDGWDEWRLYPRDFKDVSRSTFRSFLQSAANAYFDKVKRYDEEPTEAKPWITQGESWHLSQKSIRKQRSIRWKPAVLMALIGRFKSIEPALTVSWSQQTAVRLFVTGESKYAAKIVTNLARGLRVELRAPSATITPTMADQVGRDVEIRPQSTHDRIVFWIRSLGDSNAKQLAAVWRRCRAAPIEKRMQTA